MRKLLNRKLFAALALVAICATLLLSLSAGRMNQNFSTVASTLGTDSAAVSRGGGERAATGAPPSNLHLQAAPADDAAKAPAYYASSLPATSAGSGGGATSSAPGVALRGGTAPRNSTFSIDASGSGREGSIAVLPTQPVQSQYQGPSGLTAGTVDDNASYPDYLKYIAGAQQYNAANADLSERYFVQVADGSQRPVADAQVSISDGQQAIFSGRTTSDGRIAFFPRVFGSQQQSFTVQVNRDGASSVGEIVRGKTQTLALTLATQQTVSNLDIVFLLDSTGSMGDELDRIKATIFTISQRIGQLPGSPHVRFGLVTYRDRSDQYVSKHWDFTSDVATFSSNLNTIQADNGGDTPEDFNAGLADTLDNLSWNSDQQHSLRLVFTVTDAAPHNDYSDEAGYGLLMQKAAARGIKVFTVAASGMTDDGEYIYRQVAAYTQAKFVFLTYANGVSGAAGSATDMHVNQYSTNNLDEVIVSLVAAEVGNQSKGISLQKVQPISDMVAPQQGSGGEQNPANLAWPLAGALLIGGGMALAYRRGQQVQRPTSQPASLAECKADEKANEAELASGDYGLLPPPWFWQSQPHEGTRRV